MIVIVTRVPARARVRLRVGVGVFVGQWNPEMVRMIYMES